MKQVHFSKKYIKTFWKSPNFLGKRPSFMGLTDPILCLREVFFFFFFFLPSLKSPIFMPNSTDFGWKFWDFFCKKSSDFFFKSFLFHFIFWAGTIYSNFGLQKKKEKRKAIPNWPTLRERSVCLYNPSGSFFCNLFFFLISNLIQVFGSLFYEMYYVHFFLQKKQNKKIKDNLLRLLRESIN